MIRTDLALWAVRRPALAAALGGAVPVGVAVAALDPLGGGALREPWFLLGSMVAVAAVAAWVGRKVALLLFRYGRSLRPVRRAAGMLLAVCLVIGLTGAPLYGRVPAVLGAFILLAVAAAATWAGYRLGLRAAGKARPDAERPADELDLDDEPDDA